MVRGLVSIITKIISFIIPISDSILVFHSFPFFTDNSYAVYEHLKNFKCFRCIWLYDHNNIPKVNQECPPEIYDRFSFKGFWYFFRAKYIFCTHGINGFISLYQKNKIVNLWHGMPLKCIGSMDSQSKGISPTKADYLIATSPLFQDFMSRSFNNMNKENVFIVGQPRNDLMFEKTDFYEKLNINRRKYNRVGVWLPTYKQSYIGDVRCDGIFNNDGISFLSYEDLKELNELIAKMNDLLIIKLHPMDILQLKQNLPIFSNIIILKEVEFNSQLYPFLGSCDYLLTDYSSVWVDYEILNRPIGFVLNDIDEYKNTRGLMVDNLPDILPGPILSNIKALKNFCTNPDAYNYQRSEMFNTYRDNYATERLLRKLGINVI